MTAHRRSLWLRSCLGVLLAVIVSIGAARVVTTAGSQQPKSAGQSLTVQRQQADAYRAGGLRAAAHVTGRYERNAALGGGFEGPATLQELVKTAPLIVVGSADSNRMVLTADGLSVVTYYSVSIDSVVKGNPPGDVVTVILPGGKFTFPDGSTVLVRTPGMDHPGSARTAWFLRGAARNVTASHQEDIDLGGAFQPVFGPLGFYDLSGKRGSFVIPGGVYRSRICDQLRGLRLGPDAFLSEIRAMASAPPLT